MCNRFFSETLAVGIAFCGAAVYAADPAEVLADDAEKAVARQPVPVWTLEDCIDGRCDRENPVYGIGEKMTFTFRLRGFRGMDRSLVREVGRSRPRLLRSGQYGQTHSRHDEIPHSAVRAGGLHLPSDRCDGDVQQRSLHGQGRYRFPEFDARLRHAATASDAGNPGR